MALRAARSAPSQVLHSLKARYLELRATAYDQVGFGRIVTSSVVFKKKHRTNQ